MLRTAVTIRHLHFEDLGTFEPILTDAGYKTHYYDVGVHELCTLDPVQAELLIVLGGPVGVDETALYPFLAEERDLLNVRLGVNLPTLHLSRRPADCRRAGRLRHANGRQRNRFLGGLPD